MQSTAYKILLLQMIVVDILRMNGQNTIDDCRVKDYLMTSICSVKVINIDFSLSVLLIIWNILYFITLSG